MHLLAAAEVIQLFPDGTIFIHIAMVLGMIWILNRTFFRPINRVLETREQNKGEHSVEVLETWRQAYLQLADELPGTFVLDATMPREELRGLAVGVAWRKLVGETAAPAAPPSPAAW